MEFNSLTFIFVFLPIFLAIYYLAPGMHRRWILTLGSLVFYGYGVQQRPWCLALLMAMILVSWLLGLVLCKTKGRKILLGMSVTLLLGGLLWFKYAGLLGVELTLPLGMSFFTFQMVAYLCDVTSGRTIPEKNLLRYATGILMFSKLLSGPLMEPEDLRRQLDIPQVDGADLNDGLRDFIVGLSMKKLLADRVGGLWSQAGVVGYDSLSTPFAWLAIAAFSLQLYFDFCGYSYMAIGLGKMLGFRIPQNFDHPYVSRSMGEFWRRWHMTLGAWFRKYIYIPLGGSKHGWLRWLLSSFAVWLVTGIWHGSTLNFILWGMFLFVLILNERLWLGRLLNKSRVFSHAYMILMIPLSWMLFAIQDPQKLLIFLGRLFPFGGSGVAVNTRDVLLYGKDYWPYLLLGVVFATPLPAGLWKKIRDGWLGTAICLILFWICVYYLSVATNDPFMYFSF